MEPNRWWLGLLIMTSVISISRTEVMQEFEISEGVPIGTSIGFIGKPIPGSPHPPPPPPYLIVPVPGSSVDSDLTIDQSNGEILTRIQLDRETRDSYSLVAIPMTGENIRVIIRVKDENDHAPEFPSSFMHVEFPENTPRDVKRTLQPARDKDLGIYNTQRYTISAGNVNNAFRLSSHRERDGVLYLDLQVNGFLDRETTPFYSLLIEAFDGGVPPLKGSMTINITITDQNDNAPIWQFPRLSNGENYGTGESEDITFNQSRYFATVPENATIGTSVLQVFATDIDEGPNGQVSYSINRRQTDKDSVFRIDRTTGVIYVNGPLDFETKEVYELVVVARDGGIQPLETTVFVSIRVLDLNDNQMEINISFFSGDSDDTPPKVSEKALQGEFVARISVTDPDSKQEYSNVSITLEGGEGNFVLETVNSAVYLVVANRKLDRERKPSFTMSVVARDKGNPNLNASTKFTLLVEDDNDSAPKFESEEYHASVLEIAEPGTFIIQVKARDDDYGDNARVTYQLLQQGNPSHPEWFEINEDTGIITTLAHIDCEIDPTPKLTVIAKDHGKPQLSGTTTVFIHLIDTNDTPIFDRGFYNASVEETAPYGTCLLKVSASDPDCGVNAELAYNLLDQTSKDLPFSVNPKSGEICVSGPLDYEKKSIYQILVTASDTGGLSSTVIVNVQLIDENDNPPKFQPSTYSVSVKSGAVPSGPIVKVYARDEDSGRYGKVSYFIKEGNEDNLFRIDKEKGDIFLTRGPSRSQQSTYRLKISANDSYNLASEQYAEVTVHIVSPQSQAPVFQKPKYTFTLSEDASEQSSVGTVSANGNGNGRVRYSIASGDIKGNFAIDTYSGTIRTTSKLDFEETPMILLNIQAKIDQYEVIGYCQVEIQIQDVNDNTPNFGSQEIKIWVPETAEQGHIVYSAVATDKDTGVNGEVSYFMISNTQGFFKLDRSSGFLTVQRSLDYETAKEYTVVLGAKDNGNPQKVSQNLTLHIEVQDSNDNPPVWHQVHYEFWVKERSPSRTYVGRVTHRNKSQNGSIRFKLQEPSDKFQIDQNTGIINTTRTLFGNTTTYDLTVVAFNQVVGQAKAEFKVRIHVGQDNRGSKESVRSQGGDSDIVQYHFNVTESLPVNSEIARIVALDEDVGNNARVSYKIDEQQLKSVIDVYPTTGVVYLKYPLDRESQDNYVIKVVATDHGVPPLSSTTTIHITVTDENDNSPKFEQEIFRFLLHENNKPYTVIGRVTARDRDVGMNGQVKYFFQPAHENFSIDENTGEIKARESLDREKQAFYELQAVAIDEGFPPRQSEVIVQITLTDENDNEPQIVEPDHDLTVREQLPPGTEVARVVGSDPDEGKNAHITYSVINDGYSDGEDFSIDAETGAIRTKRVLSRESKTFYTLRIKARDGGHPTRDSNREIRIEVLGLNDKRLDSLFVPSKMLFKVFENATIGHSVGTITPTLNSDEDKPTLNFGIIEGNTNDAFEIHSTLGSIVVANRLNFEDVPTYSLKVRVSLQTSTSTRVTVVSVEIQVQDVNDDSAKFAMDPTIFSVSEKTIIGTLVWNFTAVDSDGSANGILHYSLLHQEPYEKFRINKLTGGLYLQSQLDYETCSSYMLIVMATDQSRRVEDRLNSSVTVSIKVQDENDNVPFFTSKSTTDIYELEPLHTAFHTVIAEDLDANENGRVTYKIVSGNDEGIFHLNCDNGRLSLAKPLKRDVKRYTLNVSATDHGPSPNAASQVVSVVVKADQNHAPRFSSPQYEAKVQENSPIGSDVLKVMAFRGDLDRNATLKYFIPEGLADGKFKVHPTTGAITVAGPIDREFQAEYSLIVYAQDEKQFYVYDSTVVNIKIVDENDNSPNFHDSCTDLTVPENNELGVIHTFTAEDPDLGKNGEVTFVIGAGNVENMFNVDLHSGKLTGRPVDRERRSHYQIVIIAQDQGSPVRKTTCNITISVDDENDSPITFSAPSESEELSLLRSVSNPEFRESASGQPIYSASIPENAPVGTTVLKVQAIDGDIGVNSIIKYSLNNESHWHFTIDNATGAIVTAGSLDREKISNYMFEVAATDGGLYDSRTSTASVHLTITDFNDNRPKFVESPIFAKIPPYTKPGQNIVQVVATDADEGVNADVTYSLDSSDPKFTVNSQNGQISAVSSLSSDRGRIFHLKVIAKDRGTPAMSSTALVSIQVGDIDPQNVLKFQETEYQADIAENSPNGVEVMKVSAIRSDGRRSRINYFIVAGNEDNLFAISSTTGEITVRDSANLDREKQSSYKLVLSAKSENNPPQLACTVVHVTLLDANDNFPRFTQESYIASVWEGNTKGTFVTQVTATDIDEGANANVIYHIIDGNRDNAFVIEPPFSGIVKTNIVLDREIQDEYRLTIIATDEGSPQMTGTCYLHVNVIDIQDQSPVFPPHSVISVSEDVPVGTLITTMVANDVDTNPTLVYGFTEDGNPGNMFSIGKYSGRVTLVKPLDFESIKSYTAKIQVSDSVHTAHTTLTVNVLDSNDHRPRFSNDVYRIIVSEGAKVGSKIGHVNATDRDTGNNGKIAFSLRNPRGSKVSGPGFLRIDETTGIIYLNASATYRPQNPFFQLIAVASDKGKPSKSSEATLWVEVRPSNSHILKFSQSKYRARLDKYSKPGTLVSQLTVERADKLGKNLHYHISIVSGNDGEYFSVNSHTGQILLSKSLSPTTEEMFTLIISADCINMDQCNSVTEVTVEVSSSAQVGPVFEKSHYKITVSESKPVGSKLLKVKAFDSKGNGSIVYDITSGNQNNLVEVNRDTGVVLLKQKLDFDLVDSYRFVIRAQEENTAGLPALWNLTTVELVVEDDNDNEPKFLFPEYSGTVGENEPIGTTVCTIRAIDIDRGIYGKLQYSIVDGDGKDKFVIAPSTGVVTTNAVFDYELSNERRYYITVKANDIGGKSSTARLQIEIDSRDDFSPEFVQKVYKFDIPRNAEPGHVVGRVEASDRDRGLDGRLIYQLIKPSSVVTVNRTNGVLILSTTPNADINSTVMIMASSGRPNSKSATIPVELVLGVPLKELEVASSAVADWLLGLLITMLLLLFIFCGIFVLIHLRNKKNSQKSKEEAFSTPSFDTLDYAPTTMRIGSTKQDSIYGSHYGNLMDLRGNDRRRINNTISELSDQSNSASSGRGSAEDGEEVEDEEICMINEGTLAQQQLRGTAGILDSGIQDEDDNASQNSAKNTQEYLARLGIRPKMHDTPGGSSQEAPNNTEWRMPPHPEGFDLYDEKDGRGVDISALIYAQISDDLNQSEETKSNPSYKNVGHPSVTGSLSSIIHNEEELAGNYNWDYLLDWGPQYQPLAHVFSEIAHLKEDSSTRSEPTYCGIQSSRNTSSGPSSEKGSSGGSSHHHSHLHPQGFPSGPGQQGGSSSVRGASNINNPGALPRTGPLPPLPILPRSPIPNDIHFASGPISPSFSPALSPLANRSPSISPLGGVATNNIRPSQFHHDNCRSDSELGM